MNNHKKKGMVPKLRFPEFRGEDEWQLKALSNCLDYLQPTNYLVTSTAYDDKYPTPVLTAGKTFILGYTNENSGILHEYLPVIIFDDFTTASKYVDFPFKIKSSAIKILRAKKDISIRFVYESMQNIQFDTATHKRHWISVFSEIKIPATNILEQQKIADCLSSLDELITAHTQKLALLKSHKKGLMQQLFHGEGKTIPELRFAEFKDAESWSIKPFHDLFTIGNGKNYKHLSKGDVPVYGSGGYMLSVNDFLYNGESVCIGRKGTIDKPVFLSGKFWTVDTLFYTHSFKECLPKFIYIIFQNIIWLNFNEAGSIPSLSKSNIAKIEVAIPNVDEQQKIADCLSSLDELITAYTQKLALLKSHKKALMQQLFPDIDGIN